MSSVREYSYKIKGLALVEDKVIDSVNEEFQGVSGVIGVNVKKEEEIIEYVLDQWSSDYDAFSKLSEICEKNNLELLFDEDEIIENAVLDEEITLVEEDKIEETPKEIKHKLSKTDFIEKAIILVLSLAFICVGFLLKNRPNIQPWIFMLGFTIASYEILYDVIVKLTEKNYLLEEVLTFLGALILTYQGQIAISAVIMLLYSALNFTVAIAKHKIAIKKDVLTDKINRCEDKKEKAILENKLAFIENNEKTYSSSTSVFNKKRLIISIVMLSIALIATFVPPLFTIKAYWHFATTKWFYLGTCILLLNGFGEVIFSLSNTETNALLYALDNGVELNSIDAFLYLDKIDKVCFDKTGVLTKNCQVESVEGDKNTLLYAISALNSSDSHVARAVLDHAKELQPLEIFDLDNSSCFGVSCKIDGKDILVGSKRFLKDNSIIIEDAKDNLSRLYVVCNGKILGIITLSVELYNDSYGAIAEIKHDLGLKTELLSSDDNNVVLSVKKQIKVDHAISGASPKFKAERVKKENAVYVGHEINDKDTLLSTDNAITFGKSGKIAITNNSIRKVPLIIKLAKRTAKTLKANKILAVSVKLILFAIAFTLRAFTKFDFIWWIFAFDVFARALTVVRSMFNSSEVA